MTPAATSPMRHPTGPPTGRPPSPKASNDQPTASTDQPPADATAAPRAPAHPGGRLRVAGVTGEWALRAWESQSGRRYELRIADGLGGAGIAAILARLPDGLGFVRAGMTSDEVLGTGRPELALEFSRTRVP
jgi:hypothetical protein